GERRFICTHVNCGKRFSQRAGLTTHWNIHTKEKPHACRVQGCDFSFGDPSSRGRHERERHQNGRFVCPFLSAGCDTSCVLCRLYYLNTNMPQNQASPSIHSPSPRAALCTRKLRRFGRVHPGAVGWLRPSPWHPRLPTLPSIDSSYSGRRTDSFHEPAVWYDPSFCLPSHVTDATIRSRSHSHHHDFVLQN
ncbi:hypothetical protein CYLTODRAFT_348960, partial [Cylindrobasidium torrendii FP15055 ss-10]